MPKAAQKKPATKPQEAEDKPKVNIPEKAPAKRPLKSSHQTKTRSVKRAPSGARVLQVPKRFWYKPLTWRYKKPVPARKPVPKARVIFAASLKQLWSHKKLFGGIVLIYGILNMILVKGIAGSSNLQTIRGALDAAASHGVSGKIVTSSVSFGYLLVTSGSGNTSTSGIYQAILLIVCSLAVIWALRKAIAKQKARIRDSFYFGMYPLVPFALIILLLSFQLVPIIVGGGLYSIATSSGITTAAWQNIIFGIVFLLLAIWTLRMVTASIFALYIVTLPDMTPMRAYHSARELVYGRRLLLWRKLLFLPIILLLLAALIEVPLIFFATPVAIWAFFVISMVSLPIVHSYLYNLYREML